MSTTASIVELLNEMLSLDPDATEALVEMRVPVNKDILDHPRLVVGGPEGRPRIGILGVLNALAADDDMVIAADFEDGLPEGQFDPDKAVLVRFSAKCRTVQSSGAVFKAIYGQQAVRAAETGRTQCTKPNLAGVSKVREEEPPWPASAPVNSKGIVLRLGPGDGIFLPVLPGEPVSDVRNRLKRALNGHPFALPLLNQFMTRFKNHLHLGEYDQELAEWRGTVGLHEFEVDGPKKYTVPGTREGLLARIGEFLRDHGHRPAIAYVPYRKMAEIRKAWGLQGERKKESEVLMLPGGVPVEVRESPEKTFFLSARFDLSDTPMAEPEKPVETVTAGGIPTPFGIPVNCFGLLALKVDYDSKHGVSPSECWVPSAGRERFEAMLATCKPGDFEEVVDPVYGRKTKQVFGMLVFYSAGAQAMMLAHSVADSPLQQVMKAEPETHVARLLEAEAAAMAAARPSLASDDPGI